MPVPPYTCESVELAETTPFAACRGPVGEPASVSVPSEPNDDVALPPKYAVPKLEKLVVEAPAEKSWSAVQVFAFPRLSETVPLVVIVPPERPVPAVMEVTVPLPPAPTQLPSIEKQPPVRLRPLAKVEVALVPVTLRYVDARAPEKVEVELVPATFKMPWMVEVPVVLLWRVEVAAVPEVLPM